ncbi:prephenate dehydratase [Leucothrix mucor]|jgi:chorismate mutase/prephenate dehydratase|uniref:prephenate dehydratase n=1 Tax=Leucothrix mucor TaxID=45248 RepID=UPI0003B76B9E|nr:prephenate dehydratase [Leucothrix mucor]
MSDELNPEQAAIEQEITEKLGAIRERIDSIDTQILDLLSARANCAEEVATTKREAGEQNIKFYRPEREAQILRRVSETNKGPLQDERVTAIFREIISSCLALEQQIKVAYLGPPGTFTESAAQKHFGQAVATVPFALIPEVFREVEAGTADYGVVPIENSTGGIISHTLDRFVNSPLKICGEIHLAIHQNLMSKSRNMSGITRIYSHEQSLMQCRDWLDRNYPDLARIAVASNAEAARLAAQDSTAAAIAGENAARLYDLGIVSPHIEDSPNNVTRFLVIGKEEVPPSGNDRTSILISTHNRSGALYHLLEPLMRHGLDMTRIESRPAPDTHWDYFFFMDLNGHIASESMQAAMAELQAEAEYVRVLGSYAKAIL